MATTITNKLKYDSLSIIFLQVFDIKKLADDTPVGKYLVRKNDSIDRQIFNTAAYDCNSVKSYRIQCEDKNGLCDGFNFHIEFNDKDKSGNTTNTIRIDGQMKIEVTVFFNRTVSVSYRMAIDGEHCVRTGDYLDTDHIIDMASLRQGAEHWNYDEESDESKIKRKKSIDILSRLGEDGRWLDEPARVIIPAGSDGSSEISDNEFCVLTRRYKKFIVKQLGAELLDENNEIEYVYVDVWENIKSANEAFGDMIEEEIIADIYDNHKREMIGLMSLYAEEWPYCSERNFDAVCGPNIAIDTDDIIMVNRDICVIFGTYGLRGDDGYVNWEKHLADIRKKYQVSWPEYLMLLEMALARRSIISSATRYLKEFDEDSRKFRKNWVQENANQNLRVANLFINLNVTDYSLCLSHKIMFERTCERLEIEQKRKMLDDTMKKVDRSMESVSEMRKWTRSNYLNVILFMISFISIISLLYQNMEMSYFVNRGLRVEQASIIGRYLLEVAFAVLGISVIVVLIKYILDKKRS